MRRLIPLYDEQIVHLARYMRVHNVELEDPRTWEGRKEELRRLGLIDPALDRLTSLGEQVREYQRQVREILDRMLKALRSPQEVAGIAQSRELRSGTFLSVLEQDIENRVLKPLSEDLNINYWRNPPSAHPPFFRIGERIYLLSRQLDFLIPRVLENPLILIEVKEYWGEKKGGSKMSDAVYEAALVGRELQEIRRMGGKVWFFMVINGQIQWKSRQGDLRKLIDLVAAGLLDDLFLPPDLRPQGRMEQSLREIIHAHWPQKPEEAPGPFAGKE